MASAISATMLLVDVPEHTLDIQMHDEHPNPEQDMDYVMADDPCDPSERQAIPASPALDLLPRRVHDITIPRNLSANVASPSQTPPNARPRADSAVGFEYEKLRRPPTAPRAIRTAHSRAGGLNYSRYAPRRRGSPVYGQYVDRSVYPDYWKPKKEGVPELVDRMADLDVQRDRRGGGGYGGNPRKRRFREDDEAQGGDDRRGGYGRPQRRKYEDHPVARLRKGLLYIAESVSLILLLRQIYTDRR